MTDKGWIVESLESSVSSQCWWAKSRSLGQNLLESYDYVETPGSYTAEFLTRNPIVRSWVFMLQGVTLSSIITVLPGSGEKQPGAQPPVGHTGRQAGGCHPPSHRTLTSPLDPSSLLGSEALRGSPCQLSVPRSAGRKVFPTASADRTSTNLSKRDLAEMPTSQLQLRNRLRFLLPAQTPTSRAAADTECLCSRRRTHCRDFFAP